MSIRNLSKSQRLLILIAISLSFFLAEIAVGFYTRAIVLVADAFHYLTDLVGYIVAFVAFKVSERERAPKVLPFGWQRATLLGAFFNGVFLLGLGLSIFLQSIERFVSIERVQKPKLVLITGCVGLALNILCVTILHEHDENGLTSMSSLNLQRQLSWTGRHQAHRHEILLEQKQKYKKSRDLGIMGVLLHVLGDAANNVGVIIAATIIWKVRSPARFYADPTVSMVIAIVIMLSSLPLMKRSGTILMQSTPGGVDPEDVKHDLQMLPQIDAIHDLHVWVLNQKKAVATAHVVVNNETVKSLNDFMQLANTVTECLHAYGIHSTTLQPEIIPTDSILSEFPRNENINDAAELQRRAVVDPSCHIGCRTTACAESTCCD